MSLERKMNRAIARKNGTGGARKSQPGAIKRNVREIDGRSYHNRKGWR